MDAFEKLEFDIICKKVSELAASETVAKKLSETMPVTDIKAAQKLLDQTGAALTILVSVRPDLAFDDIELIVKKAKVGAVPQPAELLKIGRSIAALRSLKSCVESADGCDSLKNITAWAHVCDDLERDINACIENETDLKDTASDKLYSIRRAIMRANAKLKERLDGYTRKNDISKYLQDNIVTLRDGRYVVPVRSEYRSNVKGLVHDISSTGATVFIEPFAIVEANNELKTLHTEELNEIERILTDLGHAVVTNANALLCGQEVLIKCGIIFAKAEYAKKTDAYSPVLNDNGKLILNGARHPLIPTGDVVPVDIELRDKRILLISGPNTGGKTVALKTVGLFSLMAASGMFIPAQDGSEVCIFKNIYCDIGDSQSISQSLSTFSAHITNIADVLKSADSASLVLLDEVGDGTDPDEGAALAIAIIKDLIKKNATAVITTHFNSVKEFAIECDDIENSCMQFDNINFKPTYRLIKGVSGSSYALEIAERLGLDSDIISEARARLSKEKTSFDRILREAEKLRNEAMSDKDLTEKYKQEAEEAAQKAEKYKSEYKCKLDNINENARGLIRKQADEYAEYASEIIDEIKELVKNANESALFEARKLAAKLRDKVPYDATKPELATSPPNASELKEGTRVFVSGLNKEGVTVNRPRGNKVIVAIGQIKTELPISSLSVIAEKEKHAHIDRLYEVREPITKETMLLGKTVSEAIEELDRIIPDLPPKSTLRIVHGKGTGALGKGIQQYLKKRPEIKNFRYGGYGEGDSGVTIAEIK